MFIFYLFIVLFGLHETGRSASRIFSFPALCVRVSYMGSAELISSEVSARVQHIVVCIEYTSCVVESDPARQRVGRRPTVAAIAYRAW